MPILKFNFNEPTTIALARTQGESKEGQFGPQTVYRLNAALSHGYDLTYASAALAGQIDALRLQVGERFVVTKREKKPGRGVEWTVERAQAAAPIASSPAAAKPALVPPRQAPAGSPAAPVAMSDVGASFMASGYLTCLKASIDAHMAAQAHAVAKGMAYQITPDVVQAGAATLYIQLAKERIAGGAPMAYSTAVGGA